MFIPQIFNRFFFIKSVIEESNVTSFAILFNELLNQIAIGELNPFLLALRILFGRILC